MSFYYLLPAIGSATVLLCAYRAVSFVHFRVRPSSLDRYLIGGVYAVVTGATDGIGKAVAMELAGRGFNIVLHGRNNVSSYVSVFPPPYLAAYAGAKAFVTAFSNSLSREVESVETISLLTGSVHSAGNKKPVAFLRPDSTTYAKSILSVVGCGKLSVFPYWPHAIQAYVFSLMPRRLLERAMKKAMEAEMR